MTGPATQCTDEVQGYIDDIIIHLGGVAAHCEDGARRIRLWARSLDPDLPSSDPGPACDALEKSAALSTAAIEALRTRRSCGDASVLASICLSYAAQELDGMHALIAHWSDHVSGDVLDGYDVAIERRRVGSAVLVMQWLSKVMRDLI